MISNDCCEVCLVCLQALFAKWLHYCVLRGSLLICNVFVASQTFYIPTAARSYLHIPKWYWRTKTWYPCFRYSRHKKLLLISVSCSSIGGWGSMVFICGCPCDFNPDSSHLKAQLWACVSKIAQSQGWWLINLGLSADTELGLEGRWMHMASPCGLNSSQLGSQKRLAQ